MLGEFVTLKLRKSRANPGRPRFVSGEILAVDHGSITLKVTHYDSWKNRESHQRVVLPRAEILTSSREILWPDLPIALAEPAAGEADSGGAARQAENPPDAGPTPI